MKLRGKTSWLSFTILLLSKTLASSSSDGHREQVYRTESQLILNPDFGDRRDSESGQGSYPPQPFPDSQGITQPPDSPSSLTSSQEATRRIAQKILKIRYDPQIDRIANLLEPARILQDIEDLSDTPRWMTRHSFSEGGLKAAAWLKARYEGLGTTCELDDYLPGVAPNLICRLQWSFNEDDDYHHYHHLAGSSVTVDQNAGNPIESVVLTAHYDSQGSFGFINAPGVDDDASGCAVLISIAERLSQLKLNSSTSEALLAPNHKNQRAKNREIVFVNFSGTHQGLLGSGAIARKFSEDQARSILFLMNVDMISYRVAGEPIQMGISTLGASHQSVKLIETISNLYVPELLVGNTTIGFSDEKNFQAVGITNAVRIFERIGESIKNPHYLSSSDDYSKFLPRRAIRSSSSDQKTDEETGSYDILQTVLIGKVLLACVLELVTP